MALMISRDFVGAVERTVMVPFTKALKTLSSLSDTINAMETDTVESSQCELLTELIQTAGKHTSAAEKSALALQEKVSAESRRLLNEQNKLNREIVSKQEDLKDLQKKCETMKEEKDILVNKKTECEKELQETKEKIAAAREEKQRADDKIQVSLCVMLIPVVGTIAGGISAIMSAVEYDNAVKEEKTQEEMSTYLKKKINNLKEDLCAVKAKIREKNYDIENVEKKLKTVNKKLSEAELLLKSLTQKLQQIQSFTWRLSEFDGKMRYMMGSTKTVINMRSLRGVLQELSSGHEMFFSNALEGNDVKG